MEDIPKKRIPVTRASLGWVMLFALWVILSGKLDAIHMGMGIVTILGLFFLHKGLKPLQSQDSPPLRIGRFIIYFFWLFKEMIASACFVAKVILRKDMQIDPELVYFEADQPSVLNAVIFSHSITLTPGTITLELEENRYLVHALTKETRNGLLEGSMSRRVAWLSSDSVVAQPRLLPEPEITSLWI